MANTNNLNSLLEKTRSEIENISTKLKSAIPTIEESETEGAIKVNGKDIQIVHYATDEEVEEMLNRVFGNS